MRPSLGHISMPYSPRFFTEICNFSQGVLYLHCRNSPNIERGFLYEKTDFHNVSRPAPYRLHDSMDVAAVSCYVVGNNVYAEHLFSKQPLYFFDHTIYDIYGWPRQ